MRFLATIVFSFLSMLTPLMAEGENKDVQFSLQDVGIDNKSRYAFLDVSTSNNVKTYWKYSGFGGISPEIDLSKSQNLKEYEIYWNLPKIYQGDSFINYVLSHKDKILIKATPENAALPIMLNADINYGYCDTQCKFAQTSKKISLKSDSTIKQDVTDFVNLVMAEPKGDTPFEISNFSAVKNDKAYILSFYVKNMPLLSEENFFYWFDKEYKINPPLIQKMSQDVFFITIDLGETISPPNKVEMIFPIEKQKNILYKRDLKFKESQSPI